MSIPDQMSDDAPGLLITTPAKPENVAVIRHAVAGLAERMGMGEPTLGDLKTVVTEACMNVVVHAYDDAEPGPLQVEATPVQDGIAVAVRDFGAGIRPNPGDERQSLRIGLTLIAALSASFSISGGLGQGTEVRMHLLLDPAAGNGDAPKLAAGAPPTPTATADLKIEGSDLVGPVLERVIGALAARHPIGIDRLSDLLLLADAVSDGAPGAFAGDRYSFGVGDGDGGIDLRIGPLEEGGGERLRKGLELPEVGGSLEKLADEVRLESDGDGEYLVVRIAGSAS